MGQSNKNQKWYPNKKEIQQANKITSLCLNKIGRISNVRERTKNPVHSKALNPHFQSVEKAKRPITHFLPTRLIRKCVTLARRVLNETRGKFKQQGSKRETRPSASLAPTRLKGVELENKGYGRKAREDREGWSFLQTKVRTRSGAVERVAFAREPQLAVIPLVLEQLPEIREHFSAVAAN